MNVYIINALVISIAIVVAMIGVLYKKSQYQKEADKCIKAVLRLPSGRDIYYVKECAQGDTWVEVGDASYKINPEKRRWSKHPTRPFLGLKMLQADIRTEVWDYNNPNPLIAPIGDGKPDKNGVIQYPVVTAQEVYAYSNNIQANRLVAFIQEQIERQKEIIKVFANQPNKWVVYVLSGASLIASIATLIIVSQGFGVM